MFVSPEVSNAFHVIEQSVGVIYITLTAYDGTDFQNLYLRNTLMMWYLEVMVSKRVEKHLWYFLLHERNNANKLSKIAITTRDKQAVAKSFILTFSAATQT